MPLLDGLRFCAMWYFSPFMLDVWAWLIWLSIWLVAAWFVNKTRSSEGVLWRMQHKLPQVVGCLLIFHMPQQSLLWGRLYHSLAIQVLGTVLTILGLGFTVWARVHLGRYWSGIITLKQGHRLIRTGPYRLTRHPIYTGLLTAMLGTAITVSTGDAFAGFVVIAAAYVVKARREEALLTREFGDEYSRFKQEVPMLVPFVRWKVGKRRSGTPNQPR